MREKKDTQQLGFGFAYVEMIEQESDGQLNLKYPNGEYYDPKDHKVKGGAIFGVAGKDQFITHTGKRWNIEDDSVMVPSDVVIYIRDNTASVSEGDKKKYDEAEKERMEQKKINAKKRREAEVGSMQVAEVADEIKTTLGASLFKTTSSIAKEALSWIRGCDKCIIPVDEGIPEDMNLIGLSREVDAESSPCGGGYLVDEFESDSTLVGSVLMAVHMKSPENTSPNVVPVARLQGRFTYNTADALAKKIAGSKGEIAALEFLKPKTRITKPPTFEEANAAPKTTTKKKRKCQSAATGKVNRPKKNSMPGK